MLSERFISEFTDSLTTGLEVLGVGLEEIAETMMEMAQANNIDLAFAEPLIVETYYRRAVCYYADKHDLL